MEYGVGLVSGGEVPCRYGSTFESVIGYGRAEIVDNMDDKIEGLRLIMKNQTGKEFDISEQMTLSVEVIKITVSRFTAKANSEIS